MYALEEEFNLDDEVLGFEQDAFEDADILIDDDYGYDLELELESDLDGFAESTYGFGIQPKTELYTSDSDFDLEDTEDVDVQTTTHDVDSAPVNLKFPLNIVEPDDLIASDDEELLHIPIPGAQTIAPSLNNQPVNTPTPHGATQAHTWEQNEEPNIVIDLDNDDSYSELEEEDKGLVPRPETGFEDFTMEIEHKIESTNVDFMNCDEEKEVKYERYEGREKINDDDDDNKRSESNSEEDEQEEQEEMEITNESAASQCIENMVISFLTQLAFPNGDAKLAQSNSGEEDSEVEVDMLNCEDPSTRSSSQPSQKKSNKTSKNKHKPKIELHLADRTKEETEDGTLPTKCLRFPKRMKTGSAKPFAQLFKVLDLAHEAILSGVPTTKREIYYKDVKLFKSQKVVDTLVDDLAATFDLERSDLNIRSSSKGLMCGSGLSMTLLSGETVKCNDSEGALIPAGEDIATFAVDEDVGWVLVVEKEAVFQTLCKLKICRHDSFPGRGILITGKGYPDVATRHIVKSLADALPRRIPVMCLVDGDPFGLDILSVYKYGSKSMKHENGKLATRRIKWLGIWTSELERYDVDREGLLPITRHDERKAFSMLRQVKLNKMPIPQRWKKELQYILHSRHKAEIEILCGEKKHGLESLSSRIHGPHAVLLSYLASKISGFVTAANFRTDSVEEGRRTAAEDINEGEHVVIT